MHVTEGGSDWWATAVDGIVYMRIAGQLTRDIVDATRRLQLVGLRQRPQGIGILLDVAGTLPLPPADVRAYAVEKAKLFSAGILGHVTVIEGEGFWVSAVRSALTGIFMLAASPYPRTVTSSLEGAAAFLRTRLGIDAPSTHAIVTAARSLRQERLEAFA